MDTPDTPVFIKYNNNGWIDIKPISELINEQQIKVDEFGREYDYSKKDYKVLCRSGWVEPSYIYRHKTDKDIYEVTDGDARIEVTEDHSLFNSKQEKIKPSEMEYYVNLENHLYKDDMIGDEWIGDKAKQLADGVIDRVPISILNGWDYEAYWFYTFFMRFQRDDVQYSKTCLAGLQYLKRYIKSV